MITWKYNYSFKIEIFETIKLCAKMRSSSFKNIINKVFFKSLVHWVECSPMVRETWVQSQVASYQRL